MPDTCATCGAADVLLFTCGYCDRTFCTDHTLPHHSCEGLAHPGEHVDEASFQWATAERTTADTSATNGNQEPDSGDAFAAHGFRPASDAAGADAPDPRSWTRATPAVERAPRRRDGDAVSAVERRPRDPPEGGHPAVERLPRRVTGSATPAVRPLPRQVADGTPAIRPRPATPDGQPTPAVRRAPPDPAPGPEPEPEPAPAGSGGGSADGGATEQSVPIRPMDTKRSPGRVNRSDPRTLTEWLDQQTYVSLSVKTAALAAVINGALYLGMMFTMYGLPPT
jgi:hypothetical protein